MLLPRLEDLRVDADKTQKDIAEVLGCQREVYRRYEKGIYDIPLWALVKLAEYDDRSVSSYVNLVLREHLARLEQEKGERD